VRLPTVVNLVLKEMHEKPVAPFRLYQRIAIDPHITIKQIRRQCIADYDQSLVDSSLSTLQLCNGWTWHLLRPRFWPEPSALERVHVEQIDYVNVVQSELKAWEEARPLGLEIRLSEIGARREQSVVSPSVVIGESAKSLNKTGGHAHSPSTHYLKASEREWYYKGFAFRRCRRSTEMNPTNRAEARMSE